MSTLRVDVFACDMPCRQCSMPLRWVFGLLPSHRPDGSEFTTTDFPEAVDVTRRILADPHRRHHGPGRATARPARLAAGAQLQPEYVRPLRAPSRLARSRRRHSPCPPRPMAPRGRKPGPGAAVARDPRSRAGNLLDTVNRPGPNTEWPKTTGPFPRQRYERGISPADGPGWSGDAGWWQCRFRRPAFP